jgi:DNA-binding NarL/FixJ family response regulator
MPKITHDKELMSRVRILLADDHTLFLEGLRRLLEQDFDIVGAVTNGRELIAAAEQLLPDVILLDISMPLLNGFDAARQLKQNGVRAKLLFVTMHAGADYVKEAFRVGASGYVLKQSAGAELVGAIHEVATGKYYLAPLASTESISSLINQNQPVSGRASGELTLRQREVLQLVAEGHAAKAIADLLSISQKTVEFHKASMMRQLGLRSSAELIRYAVSHGLVSKE